MKYKANLFSPYKVYCVTESGTNISNVVDKMIRLTAKMTERYASDIYYDIVTLFKAVDDEQDLDRVLLFREYGVSTKVVTDDTIELFDDSDIIQSWRLCHTPASDGREALTSLTRVYLRRE